MEILTGRTEHILSLLTPYLTDVGVADELDSTVADRPGKTWWVAVADGRVVGFCGAVEPDDAAGAVELESFYVRPDRRGRGVGRALYAARLAAYPGRRLVGYAADESLPLYLEYGFTAVRDDTSPTGHHWTEVRLGGRTIPEPPPSMTIGATMTGKRILRSDLSEGLYAWADDEEILDEYAAAIKGGTVLRESETPGEDPDYMRVIEYTDPQSGGTRYLVDIADPNGSEWADYADRAEAEAEYEDLVRDQDGAEWLYESTDVDGVAERDPDGDGEDDRY